MNIFDFPRETVKALAQQGWMNIKAITHYDICKSLCGGKTVERVADDMRIPYDTVLKVKKKCPC